MDILIELWAFMRERKKFWLLPILILMLLLGGLVVLTQGSAVAPCVYTVFGAAARVSDARLGDLRVLSRQRRRCGR